MSKLDTGKSSESKNLAQLASEGNKFFLDGIEVLTQSVGFPIIIELDKSNKAKLKDEITRIAMEKFGSADSYVLGECNIYFTNSDPSEDLDYWTSSSAMYQYPIQFYKIN